MPRMSTPPPKPPRRPPPRAAAAQTLREPRDMRDRPRGWKLALRRQRRRLRPILYGATVIACLGGVALFAAASNHDATLTTLRGRFGTVGAWFGLRLDHVIVQGRTTTPEPLVNAALGIAPGGHLLGFSVADARARLLTIPSIEDATVERRWPGTVLVALTERHPFAVWQHDRRYTLIDRDGAILADQDARLAGNLPLVVGQGAPTHAAELLDLLATHPAIQSHLVAATRVSDRRWNLLVTSGATIELPEDDQAGALSRLDALQTAHQILDRKLLVIDLRLTDHTTVRTPTPPPAPPT